jgi:hypothetical protein
VGGQHTKVRGYVRETDDQMDIYSWSVTHHKHSGRRHADTAPSTGRRLHRGWGCCRSGRWECRRSDCWKVCWHSGRGGRGRACWECCGGDGGHGSRLRCCDAVVDGCCRWHVTAGALARVRVSVGWGTRAVGCRRVASVARDTRVHRRRRRRRGGRVQGRQCCRRHGGRCSGGAVCDAGSRSTSADEEIVALRARIVAVVGR